MPDATALVTGASGGIGKEIAHQLAAAGLAVYVGSRTIERGQRAVGEIGANARLLVVDVTDSASIAEATGQVEHLDVLVNNAVVMVDGNAAPEADAGPDRWRGARVRIRSSPPRPGGPAPLTDHRRRH
jgi:NADP-dependent 3-hydroxy acid dehydrogenase YdfG